MHRLKANFGKIEILLRETEVANIFVRTKDSCRYLLGFGTLGYQQLHSIDMAFH